MVLWQRNRDSQLPLTQQGLASQGQALSMVLNWHSQPHRLLRDKEHPLKGKIDKKLKLLMLLILTSFLSLTILQTAAGDSFTSLTSNTLCMSAVVKMLWPSLQYLQIAPFIGLMMQSQTSLPCLRIRKGGILDRIADLTIPVLLIKMLLGKLSIYSCFYYHILLIMKILKGKFNL